MIDLVKELREALEEAEAVLALSEHPPLNLLPNREVTDLGRRIGFGALMTSAELAWRSELGRSGEPLGTEHTHGPGRATVDGCLKQIRSALSRLTDGGVPVGWKLVPVEPTEEMKEAAAACPQMKVITGVLSLHQARGYVIRGLGASKKDSALSEAYRAMLAASPPPPSESGEG